MTRVLMPVDDEPDRLDRQLETLRDVFGGTDVEVTVLYVHEEIDTAADEAGSTVIRSINESIESIQDVPETVERAGTTLEDEGLTVDVRTTSGDAEAAILEVADEIEADVILIAGSKRTPVGKAVFGSVTQGVIIDGDRPVLVAERP